MTPLAGKHIVVTRTVAQAQPLVAALEAYGATVTICPLIAIAPPTDWHAFDRAIQALESYTDLVFSSANAVRHTIDRLQQLAVTIPASVRISAVGEATAATLRERRVSASIVPERATASGLADALGVVAGRRMLLPSGDRARAELAQTLRSRGAIVDVVTCYRTIAGDGVEPLRTILRSVKADALVFASPSAFHFLHQRCDADDRMRLAATPLVAIGPTTAAAIQQHGLHCTIAQQQTDSGIVAAVCAALGVGTDQRSVP